MKSVAYSATVGLRTVAKASTEVVLEVGLLMFLYCYVHLTYQFTGWRRGQYSPEIKDLLESPKGEGNSRLFVTFVIEVYI
jgi:hypothetical protein